jgi:hypothetical protein
LAGPVVAVILAAADQEAAGDDAPKASFQMEYHLKLIRRQKAETRGTALNEQLGGKQFLEINVRQTSVCRASSTS